MECAGGRASLLSFLSTRFYFIFKYEHTFCFSKNAQTHTQLWLGSVMLNDFPMWVKAAKQSADGALIHNGHISTQRLKRL